MAKVGVDDAMIARMWAKEAPLGFNNADQFNLFKTEMDDAFKQAGLTDAEVGLKGTSTTFYSENPSKRLGHHWDADPANLGDYDINITSPTMKAKLDELGIAPSEKYGVFKTRDIESSFKPLDDFQKKWAGELGRDVNFVGYPKPVARDATEYILRAQDATNRLNGLSKVNKISESGYRARIESLEKHYGTINVHSLEKHGAPTTGLAQYRRVKNTDYPNPTTGAPGNPTKNASKFLTNKDHYETLRRAILQHKKDPTQTRIPVHFDRSIGVNIKNLGTHTNRGPYSAQYVDNAVVNFDPQMGKFFTAYPTP